MKIAFILPSLENKGPIVFTQYLLDYLNDYVDEIKVFYFKEKKGLNINVPCQKIGFFEKIDFSNYDIIHTTQALPDLYGALFIEKSKWVSSIHNFMIEDLSMIHSKFKTNMIVFLWKWALRKCQNIVVSSSEQRHYYESFLKTKINYFLIPYGVKEKSYTEINQEDLSIIKRLKENNYFIIGAVGLLIPRKGYKQLISLLEKDKNSAVVIVGDGPEKEALEKAALLKNVNERLIILGFRNNSYNYYKYFDAYAHVSYSEGFGLAMLEALTKKLPIICSNLPIYSDFISNQDVSFMEPGNEKSLFEAYDYVKMNKTLLSERAYELYNNIFSLKKMGENHICMYKKMVGKE